MERREGGQDRGRKEGEVSSEVWWLESLPCTELKLAFGAVPRPCSVLFTRPYSLNTGGWVFISISFSRSSCDRASDFACTCALSSVVARVHMLLECSSQKCPPLPSATCYLYRQVTSCFRSQTLGSPTLSSLSPH